MKVTSNFNDYRLLLEVVAVNTWPSAKQLFSDAFIDHYFYAIDAQVYKM